MMTADNTLHLAVIGDVHSSYDQLTGLLSRVPEGYNLVFVGDLTDRGPDPVGVLKLIMDGGHRAVRGNHDDKLLRALKGNPVQVNGGLEHTLAMIRRESTAWQNRLCDWLAELPSFLLFPGVAIAHAYWSPTCPEDDHIWGPRTRDDDGRVHRVQWWEDPAFLTPGWRVIFGHYHMPVYTPQAVCVDFGAPVGPLAAYLVDADQFVTVPPAIDEATYLQA